MDAPLKEVAKIDKLSSKETFYPAHDSLEVILSALHDARSQVLAGNANQQTFTQLASLVDAKKKEIDERQKEMYSSLSRMGKSLDKAGYPLWFQLTNIHSMIEIPESSTNLFGALFVSRICRCSRKNGRPSLPQNRSV